MLNLTTKQKRAVKRNLTGYSFILPNLIGYTLFILVPVLFSFVLSVMEWDGSQANPMEFVGLNNFIQLTKDSSFKIAFANSIKYVIMVVPITIVLSLLIAVLLNQKVKGMKFFRAAFFFPYVASLVAVGAVWNMMFQKDFGPINQLLMSIGIENPPGWVASTEWSLIAVAIVSVWRYAGYYMVVYLAGLQGISKELYEAASIDGANGWRKFRSITVPMLTPTTFFVSIMLTINCFKEFGLVHTMTGGGPGRSSTLLVNFIYNSAFVSFDYGYASAAAIVLFVMVLVVTLVQFRGEKKYVNYM